MTGSIWTDLLLFAVFIAILSIGVFRLDTIITASRPKPEEPPRKLCSTDNSGKIILLDPDGRRSRRRKSA